jgi:hypothetical protein
MSIIDFYAFFSLLVSVFCGKIMKGNRKNEWIDLCVGNRFGMQRWWGEHGNSLIDVRQNFMAHFVEREAYDLMDLD